MAPKTKSILLIVGMVLPYMALVIFVYGVRQAVKGELPLSRAIPAGAFLLAFIGLFSWSLFRDDQARKRRAD